MVKERGNNREGKCVREREKESKGEREREKGQ